MRRIEMALFVAGLAVEHQEVGRLPQQFKIELADDRLPGLGLVRPQAARDCVGRARACVVESVDRRGHTEQLFELGVAGAENPRVSPVRTAKDLTISRFSEDSPLDGPGEELGRGCTAMYFAQ